MSCKIIIDYPHPKDEAIQKLKNAIELYNGEFDGNTLEGHFKVGTPIGFFEAKYSIQGDEIEIDIVKKPFLISCEKIEKEIKKYLENNLIEFDTPLPFDQFIKEYKHNDTPEKKYNKEIRLLQEEYNKEVRKIMSKQLTTLSFFDLKDANIDTKVKRAILNVKGNYSSDPSELPNSMNLKANLLYNSNEYIMLAIKLNELIPDKTKRITMAEMSNCKTVSDCIILVTKKL